MMENIGAVFVHCVFNLIDVDLCDFESFPIVRSARLREKQKNSKTFQSSVTKKQ